MARFVFLTPEGRVLHVNPPGKLQVEAVNPRTLLPVGLPQRTVLGGREVLAMVTPCRWDGNPCLTIWYNLMSDVVTSWPGRCVRRALPWPSWATPGRRRRRCGWNRRTFSRVPVLFLTARN